MSEAPNDDRIAFVTGASAGIGAALTRALLGRGMRVATCARRHDRLLELADDSQRDRYLPLACDLRDEAQILSCFDQIRDRPGWGGVDVMVNNAGLGHRAPLTTGRTDDFREMLDVNVLALCICTREAVQDMRRRGDRGHVFHVSSMAGHRVPPGSGVYAATKFAVTALTEGLRRELRELQSQIRVTAVSPGFVETEFAEHYHRSKEAAQTTYSRYKVLEPSDVAQAVLYALDAPAHVQIHDILMRPTDQPD